MDPCLAWDAGVYSGNDAISPRRTSALEKAAPTQIASTCMAGEGGQSSVGSSARVLVTRQIHFKPVCPGLTIKASYLFLFPQWLGSSSLLIYLHQRLHFYSPSEFPICGLRVSCDFDRDRHVNIEAPPNRQCSLQRGDGSAATGRPSPWALASLAPVMLSPNIW